MDEPDDMIGRKSNCCPSVFKHSVQACRAYSGLYTPFHFSLPDI
uniref:Uncharacterized protein n=2 Tax=Anguilla anguilla TaxID=7936 RepID=A0A0E9RKY4_ANGAN